MAEYRNRGDGKWQVVLSNGYTPSGKHKRVYRTITVDPEKTENAQRRAVEREAAKLQADFDRHVLTEAKKIRLSAVIDEYLENHPMADSTKAWYKGLFERIRPALGKIYVQDLTARQIREFYKELSGTDAKPARSGKKNAGENAVSEKPKKKECQSRSKTGKLSGTYRLHYHRALSAVLGFAVKSGYITVNPMIAVDAPKADTPEATFLEDEDLVKLLEVLDCYPDPMWKAFFLLALFSSCRPGEIIGLNWEDLEDNILTICAGSNRVDGKTIRTE